MAFRPLWGQRAGEARVERLWHLAGNLEFKVRGHDFVGRQSQTWVRFPDLGWKVVAAHVSTVSDETFW